MGLPGGYLVKVVSGLGTFIVAILLFTRHLYSNQRLLFTTLKKPAPLKALPTPGCYSEVQDAATDEFSFLCGPAIRVDTARSIPEARDRVYNHITRLRATCSPAERVGHVDDGGWWMCKASPFSLKQGCLVYSFGISNDWSFDDHISRKYGCEVHSFDPTIHRDDHMHSKLVHFHNTGIGGQDEVNNRGWKMRTLCTLFKELGHQHRIIDFLKIDVEGSEWPSIPSMLEDGCLSQVKQLAIELHTHVNSRERYDHYWQCMQGLENEGFHPWWILNRHDRDCFTPKDDGVLRCPLTEMSFININYAIDMDTIIQE